MLKSLHLLRGWWISSLHVLQSFIFLRSSRLCFALIKTQNITAKLLQHNICHNLRYISFLVACNNSFPPFSCSPTVLSLQFHRQKLRKQINNSRKINTLYIHITFYKLLSTMSRKVFHALLIFHFLRLPLLSFFFLVKLLQWNFRLHFALEKRENVKLKGVKSVLINLNISFKHFIMSWKRCVHGKLKKVRENEAFFDVIMSFIQLWSRTAEKGCKKNRVKDN